MNKSVVRTLGVSVFLPLVLLAMGWAGYRYLTQPPEQPVANGASGPPSSSARGMRAGLTGGARAGGPAIVGTSVRALDVRAQPQASELRLLAQVQASLVEDIQAPASGRITDIFVSPGAQVDQGQVLLRMEAPESQWQVRQRQAALQETLARQNLARQQHQQNQQRLQQERDQLARVQRLHGQGFASDSELQAAQNQLANLALQVALFADEEEQRLAQIEQARIQLEQAQHQQAQLAPEAPYASLVAELMVREQQAVQTGQTLVRLLDPNSLSLQVRVPVAQLPRLAEARGELRLAEGIFPAPIRQINPISDQGTLSVGLDLPAAAPVVSGQTLDLWLLLPLATPVWAVPQSSLYQGDTLYLIDQGRLQAQRVEVLGQQWRQQQLWYLLAPPEGFEQAQVLTTRLNNPVSGQAVQVTGVQP